MSAQPSKPAEPRAVTHALLPQPKRGTFRCIYCGARAWGRTCTAHRDLPQLEYGGLQ